MQKAFIVGLAGIALTPDEKAFLADERPAGLILFARNCRSAGQISELIAAFKAASGSERCLVMIDHEGGRVQRIRPPTASLLPSAAACLGHADGDVKEASRLAHLVMRLAAAELKTLGFNTNCAPVLDVPVAGAHDIIGNRAYARDAASVAAIGSAAARGLMAGGMLPVIKHIPGHGRARSDSHLELPVVDTARDALAASDFEAFRRLAHLPAAMTAHVVYSAVDGTAPASTSFKVTDEIIRSHIGFSGLLMSDDLGMRALSGSFDERTRAVINAGSDLALHCSGNMQEMAEVGSAAPALDGLRLERYLKALEATEAAPEAFDIEDAREVVRRMLAAVA